MNRSRPSFDHKGGLLWKDRKHTFLGLPWSFEKYSLDEERLFIEKGLLTTRSNEVRLYRILDLSLKQTLGQKILGLGTVKVDSSDKNMKMFLIPNICHPVKVKELLSKTVEAERQKKRISGREFIVEDGDDDGVDVDEFDI
ncbi:MAG: PH domain-containing protein [Lachnospiraceae bacterium]|nr:PH domain-containing protein [Lachnospiraceae bacterium]